MGCHDKQSPTFEGFTEVPTLALRKGVQRLEPFYGEARGFSFQREIQPILDRHCVECHDGSDKLAMDLTATPVRDAGMNQRLWSRSYLNLTGASRDKNGNYSAVPETGVVTWISKMSRPTELPHSQGSIRSPLVKMIDEGHHDVKLSDEEYHKLVAWIDLLVPFCGTYREAGDWSGKDHDYYSYYEDKRKAQAGEEASAVAAYIDSLSGESVDRDPGAPFTRAVYRPLELTDHWKSKGPGEWVLGEGHEPALIDRFEWRGGSSIKLMVREQELGRLENGVLVLDKPVRSGELRVLAEAEPASLGLHGLEIRELPEHEGYRRHLEFVR